MKKHDVAEKIIELQNIIETAKDCLLENQADDCYLILQRAKRELNHLLGKMLPTGSTA